MRILVAHNAYRQRGGEDVVVEDEARLLETNGHDVKLYSRSNDELEGIGSAVAAVQTIWSPRTYRQVRAEIRLFRPDVVHVHNTFPLISPSLYWAAAREGVPVVQTLHNFRLFCAQATFLRDGRICEDCLGALPWRGVMHACYRSSRPQTVVLVGMLAVHRAAGTYRTGITRYIALNEFCRRKFVEAGLPAQRIAVKPNFVDLPCVEPGPRAGGLFVGRLSTEKGIETLCAVVARLHGANFKVIGDGPLSGLVRSNARFSSHGWQLPEAVYAHMRGAAYLVLPSLCYESFPRTLVEAFASGLPVVASRIGAFSELVDHGRTGLLFEPGSVDDLARQLGWADSHPDEMRRMGDNARLEYERKYTPAVNYDQLDGIYRTVLEEQDRGLATSA